MRSCLSCECPASCVLAHLPETGILEISETVKALYYQRGQVIWREGIYRPGCFVICQGDAILTVRKSGEAKPRILKSLQAGDLVPCLNGAHIGDPNDDFVVQVQATTPVLVRYLPAESFRSLLIRYPSMAIKVIEILSVAIMQLLHELLGCNCKGKGGPEH